MKLIILSILAQLFIFSKSQKVISNFINIQDLGPIPNFMKRCLPGYYRLNGACKHFYNLYKNKTKCNEGKELICKKFGFYNETRCFCKNKNVSYPKYLNNTENLKCKTGTIRKCNSFGKNCICVKLIIHSSRCPEGTYPKNTGGPFSKGFVCKPIKDKKLYFNY